MRAVPRAAGNRVFFFFERGEDQWDTRHKDYFRGCLVRGAGRLLAKRSEEERLGTVVQGLVQPRLRKWVQVVTRE